MTDKRKQRIIKREEKPVLDSTIYPRLTKKSKSTGDLPYRKLYNLEIFDAAGTSYQGLEDLQTLGPFQARGSVPLTETIRSTGDSKERGRLINIKAESIVEWTHEFNESKVMEPVFWILSEDVCWYQIQNMHPNYDPWIRPLADVCVYLDALIYSHFTLKVNDELKDLIPRVSKLLNMSTEAVMDALKEHQEQILRLCQPDKELKKLRFVQTWLKEMPPPSIRRSRSVQPSSALVHPSATPAPSSSTSTPVTTPTPTPTSVPKEDENMARTKAAIKLAQRQAKKRLLSPPQHHSELEPVMATSEGDKNEHKEKVGKYMGKSAPCPGNCPLHEKTMVFDSELEMLVNDIYDKQDGEDGKKNYSVPYDFQCPIDTCLINISNSLSPTPSDFAELILQHLCEHDLKANNNMEHIKRYLATSLTPVVKLGLKVKNQQQQVPEKALNVHLYWELQAGSFQFNAGNSNAFASGATKQTAMRNIPTQTRSGRRQANHSRTRPVQQRPNSSDLEPMPHIQYQQTIFSSDASPSLSSHEAQTQRSDRAPNQVRSTTIASGIDEPTTAPVPFATALAAHQSAISSLSQTRPPMRAIEIADDDGDYNGDDDDDGSMRMIEDETMVTAFSRRPYIDESEATRQHAQFQDSARVPISTSKFHKAAKRDRSDSYDDDFMQPKHRMPYKNRFEVTNTRAPVPPPVARELIEIHDTDSEASGEDYNLDDNCVSGRLERKRQRTMEHGTNMASCSDHQRSASFSKTFDTFATSQSSTSPNSNANSNTNSNNNTCSNWDKPARITM
ncbi:hypothetical protein BGZ59_005752 [Podila verticillata]|nr:hypothetical protein BGZ59_005752 [Podila verticillata]